jgi:ABC transport system ATP-binding/permease protein
MEVAQPPRTEVSIRFLNGPLANRVVPLKKSVITVGRDSHSDIVIPDLQVSRQHARISWKDGAWTIENISQSSYVTIDQQRTGQGILRHESVVEIGKNIRFVFLVQQPGALTEIAPIDRAEIEMIPTVTVKPFETFLPETPAALKSSETFLPETPVNIPAAIAQPETVLAFETPSLVITSNIHSGRFVHLLTRPVQNIGRDSENEIIINEAIVSSWHAQIVREDGNLFLVHPHPSRGKTLNGLWYQGQRIPGDQQFRKQLQPGDIFRIGDEHGTLVTLTYDAGRSVPLATLAEMQPIPLNGERLTIGRIPENTVVLNHPQVSAHHAVLEKVDGGYRILDSNSTNHVYVNGERVTQQVLRTGDEIRIGPYRLAYNGSELRQYDESGHIRIDALHLKKVGNNHTILLNDISLVIPPRKFVALVGGSGAGKSTLMDALNGLRPAQEGAVFYNNVDYYHHLEAFNTQLGYVPQDDIVHRELTVERALYYAARLRLPGDFTREQIQWRINEVLEDVEMIDRRTLLVNKLSGGQRKRVSIAMELLANPGVFFLDEPTSGLDPGLDRKMMTLLRRLADGGRTIVLVTHATNNINTCDYVCFLAQGGRLAYFGPPEEAKTFFGKTDFGEIYSTLEPTREQPDIPKQAEELFLASPDYQRYVAKPLLERPAEHESHETPAKAAQQIKRGNAWSQFLLLSSRYLELLKNDTGNLLILLLQAPVIAIMLVLMVRFEVGAGVFDAGKLTQCSTQILTASGPLALPQAQHSELIGCQQVLNFLQTSTSGQVFAQQKGGVAQALQSFLIQGPGVDAQKVLFIMAFATVLFGCINGAREIVKEAAIYNRERAVNLGILPYMFSKIVVLGLLCLFQSAILTFVVELGEPLQQGILLSPILETYITLSLTSLAGLMIGLTISAIAPNNDRAISLVPIILLPQVIFSGAIIPLKDWFTQILATIFPTRWAMAALGSSIGLHADTVGGDRLFGNDYTYHSTLFSIYSQSEAAQRLFLSWGALGALIVVLMLVVGFFLKRKDIKA